MSGSQDNGRHLARCIDLNHLGPLVWSKLRRVKLSKELVTDDLWT